MNAQFLHCGWDLPPGPFSTLETGSQSTLQGLLVKSQSMKGRESGSCPSPSQAAVLQAAGPTLTTVPKCGLQVPPSRDPQLQMTLSASPSLSRTGPGTPITEEGESFQPLPICRLSCLSIWITGLQLMVSTLPYFQLQVEGGWVTRGTGAGSGTGIRGLS